MAPNFAELLTSIWVLNKKDRSEHYALFSDIKINAALQIITRRQ